METPNSYHSHPADATPLYGDWRINDNNNMILPIQHITHLLTEDVLMMVDHKNIAWKGKHHYPMWNLDNCACCNGERYRSCDIKYPGIITNGPNPFDNPYRMLDGKHRMQKMRSMGITKSMFYVLDWNKVYPYFKEAPWKETN